MRILGMMSGTSVDAVDVAVCEVSETGIDLVSHGEHPWPSELRSRILAALYPAEITMAEVCALDQLIGQHFAAAAEATLTGFGAEVDLVASHGQTVHHWVDGDGEARGTLQLGEAAWIARSTGCPVVSNLRAADIAAGGQGAPLVPVLDALLFGETPSAVVNLGGIANLSVVAEGRVVVAGDTGPANCLSDAVVQRATHDQVRFDPFGEMAAAGHVHPGLLALLLQQPWLSLPLPKSTGREVFSLAWYDQVLKLAEDPDEIDLADQLATLAAFTATTLLAQIEPHHVARLVVSGGGVHHRPLMAALAERYDVVLSDELGIPGDAKEAILVAYLGWLRWQQMPGQAVTVHSTPATGARSFSVLGDLTDLRPNPLSAERGGAGTQR